MDSPAPPAAQLLLLAEGGELRALLEASCGEGSVAGQTSDPDEAIRRLQADGAPNVLVVRIVDSESSAYLVARLRAAAPEAAMVVCTASPGTLDLRAAGADEWVTSMPPAPGILEMAVRMAREKRALVLAWERERDLLQALLEVLPERIYFKDKMSRFLRVSRSMAEAARSTCEEIVGKSDFDLFLPDHAQEAFQDERKILRTAAPMPSKEEKEIRPNGKVDWVQTRKFPLRDRRGNLQGTFGISRLITDFKEIEGELQRERNLLASVIRNIPDSIFAKNSDGQYLLSNQAHAATLGQDSPQKVVGRTVYDFFSAEAAHRFAMTDRKLLETREAMINVEEEAEGADGRHRWLLTTKVPLFNSEDEGILVCIGRDITQRKEAELKLMEVNADLHATTAELKRANEEMRALQLQVIEAEKHRSVARLAAGVAHEVKNPLAIITMGAEYLRSDETVNPDAAEVVERILDAAGRADLVIKGLLDFSVPHRLELELCGLNEIVRKAVALVQGECTQSEVKVELALGEIPDLPLDRSKISQILINILMNAVQAMGGPGTLTITTWAEQVTHVRSSDGRERSSAFLAGEPAVVLRVEDTGPGIPQSHLDKIFDPFFTTKPTGKGTGLGMTVVKSIVDLHRGAIEIKNRVEGGAAVTISFKAGPL